MIITTAKKPDPAVHAEAWAKARAWNAPYVPREKRSIRRWQQETNEDIYIVASGGDTYYPLGEAAEPLVFHPSMAWLRGLHVHRGGSYPLLEAADVREGDTVLDATLGFGADSIMLALGAGNTGTVLGIEKQPVVASLVRKGLRLPGEYPGWFINAMQRITVVQGDSLRFLSLLPESSMDVVYLDPMFAEAVDTSPAIDRLRPVAATDPLTDKWIEEALRVARRRIVLKDYAASPHFKQYQLTPAGRRSAAVRYGWKEAYT
ncbi:class I SAM-dependent methyltransferase [Marinococcus luteus]|uniref:class I SAM-dependent methyltransferase n=1 Tax=Marinococcus luteus TaxID=1122204 RepID=UPI002ACCBC4E|nr:class I SAM-dependent methyltransferase [Marinococcus luteus]MDZ5781878.1 class I SAM-dependent methyltransferase [Marinococcus luteus]